MNFALKTFFLFFFYVGASSSFCSDKQKAAARPTLHLEKAALMGGLVTVIGATGYMACDYCEQFLCGPYSQVPNFSPCTGEETRKGLFLKLFLTGATLTTTAIILAHSTNAPQNGTQQEEPK